MTSYSRLEPETTAQPQLLLDRNVIFTNSVMEVLELLLLLNKLIFTQFSSIILPLTTT